MSTVAASADAAFVPERTAVESRGETYDTVGEIHSPNARITVREVNVWYGEEDRDRETSTSTSAPTRCSPSWGRPVAASRRSCGASTG